MTHCSSCGRPIPEGQGTSCSMCYGDIDYGRDGYYRDYFERQQELQREKEEEQQQSDEEDLK
jgi:uncharacterized Zn finger protein (UPF0148 family)